MINFKRIAKRATVAAIAATTVMNIAVSANAYSLKYIFGAPSSAQTMTTTESAKATGAQKITINSTEFKTTVSAGAYINASCTNFSAYTAVISNPGPYYMDYTGNTVPKNGETVYVKFELVNYVDSKTVDASGNISA